MKKKAKEALFDSIGDGGGLNNLASVGLSGVFCGVTWVATLGQKVNMDTCVIDYRNWGDEDKGGAVWDSLVFGLATAGTYMGLSSLSRFAPAKSAPSLQSFAKYISAYVGLRTADYVKDQAWKDPEYTVLSYDKSFDHRP